jgi:hypothetical protein
MTAGEAGSKTMNSKKMKRKEKGCRHSKGALAIENALRSLPSEWTKQIMVHTFGCVI